MVYVYYIALHKSSKTQEFRGSDVLFIFHVSGYPRPSIRWRIEGEILNENEDPPETAMTTWTLETGLEINISFTNGLSNKSYDDIIDDGRGGSVRVDSDSNIFPPIIHSNDRNNQRRESQVSFDQNNFGNDDGELFPKHQIPAQLATTYADGHITKRWLTVYDVSRQLLMARIECRARNSKTLPPVTASAAIDMNRECKTN